MISHRLRSSVAGILAVVARPHSRVDQSARLRVDRIASYQFLRTGIVLGLKKIKKCSWSVLRAVPFAPWTRASIAYARFQSVAISNGAAPWPLGGFEVLETDAATDNNFRDSSDVPGTMNSSSKQPANRSAETMIL